MDWHKYFNKPQPKNIKKGSLVLITGLHEEDDDWGCVPWEKGDKVLLTSDIITEGITDESKFKWHTDYDEVIYYDEFQVIENGSKKDN